MNNRIAGIFLVLLLILVNFPFVLGNETSPLFNNLPPIAEANGPYYGNVGENISFDSSGSYDPEGTELEYLWDFGDGNTSTQANPVYAYSEYGEYTVILTCWDDIGKSDSDTTYSVINAFAVAIAGGPYYGNIEENITFDASDSYDLDGEIISYEWIFGDWTNASGMIVNHKYINPGEYTVVLTVVDDDGAISNDTTTAYVNSPPMAPYINGTKTGNPGTEYEYVFNSVDPEGNDVNYKIDWGDDTSFTTGFFTSGVDVNVSHTWAEKGEYTITAYAEDTFGATSRTSIFQVTIPRNKVINNPFLNWLQSHPNWFPLLQKLIQQLGFGM